MRMSPNIISFILAILVLCLAVLMIINVHIYMLHGSYINPDVGLVLTILPILTAIGTVVLIYWVTRRSIVFWLALPLFMLLMIIFAHGLQYEIHCVNGTLSCIVYTIRASAGLDVLKFLSHIYNISSHNVVKILNFMNAGEKSAGQVWQGKQVPVC